jgi:uncharacterized protein
VSIPNTQNTFKNAKQLVLTIPSSFWHIKDLKVNSFRREHMLEIDEMGTTEIQTLLSQAAYGHLGCSLEGHPYVVPMRYYFENPNLYVFTTEGMKTHYMDENPEVCLQVEDLQDMSHWRSVVVMGRSERITDQDELERVTQAIKIRNPQLSPAINHTWTDAWGRGNVVAIYRIHPSEMTGRTTDGLSSQSMNDVYKAALSKSAS